MPYIYVLKGRVLFMAFHEAETYCSLDSCGKVSSGFTVFLHPPFTVRIVPCWKILYHTLRFTWWEAKKRQTAVVREHTALATLTTSQGPLVYWPWASVICETGFNRNFLISVIVWGYCFLWLCCSDTVTPEAFRNSSEFSRSWWSSFCLLRLMEICLFQRTMWW